MYPSVDIVTSSIIDMRKRAEAADDARIPLSRDSWDEDDGSVLWWRFPIVEPPYVGTPLDDDFPDYVTHWTRIVLPFDAVTEGDGT